MGLFAEFIRTKNYFEKMLASEKKDKSYRLAVESIIYSVIAVALIVVFRVLVKKFGELLQPALDVDLSGTSLNGVLPALIKVIYVLIDCITGFFALFIFSIIVMKCVYQLKLNKQAVGIVACAVSGAAFIATIWIFVLLVQLTPAV